MQIVVALATAAAAAALFFTFPLACIALVVGAVIFVGILGNT